jgi:uncharacterized protein
MGLMMKGDLMFKFLLGAVLALTAFSLQPVFADGARPMRTISISGHGEVKAAPDMAVVTLGTLSQAETAKAALDENTKNMENLFAMLKAAGIADKDMQTSNFSVGPRYDYGNNNGQAPKLVGYDVSNNVTVIIHKIGDLGAVLDKAVSAGSNQINGIGFSVSDPQAAQDKARELAVKDATARAVVLTKAANVGLGDIQQISEGGNVAPQPMVMRSMAMDSVAKAVPVAAGEVGIAADVNMVWELK